MKFAYADPPYIGQAKRYEGGVEVNHAALIDYLDRDFDGWALSCSVPSLEVLLPMVPGKYRVLAWVKRYAPHRPNVWPTYAWEPVICKPMPRKHSRSWSTPFDWRMTEPGGFRRTGRGAKQNILGEKPPEFTFWLLDCCKVRPEDEIEDIFPGSGAVGEAVEAWRRQGRLALSV